LSGVWQGPGTNCAAAACPNLLGACCFSDGTCLDGLTAGECAAEDGDFRGEGTLCAGTVCPIEPPPPAENVYQEDLVRVTTQTGLCGVPLCGVMSASPLMVCILALRLTRPALGARSSRRRPVR
jgi:hypothetical protein